LKIKAALTGVSLLGIETAPFIYFVERKPAYIDRMRAIFAYVKTQQLSVIASTSTLTEVLVFPLQMGQTQYVRQYRDMLLNTRQISTIPVSSSVAEKAAELRGKYRLKTPDAIHVATSIMSGCNAFLTNDRDLKRITEVPVLLLDELELDT
jgi:predicted nucleic acid-binding protein